MPIDDDHARTLHRRTDGNPYFAQELMLAGLSPDGPLPPSLQDVLLSRLASQPQSVQELLRVMAVVGREVDDRLLAELSDLPERDLELALRSAMVSGILAQNRSASKYRFRHALMREAIDADLLPAESRRIHSRVAEVLVARPGFVGAVERSAMLAHHWQAAGEWDHALAERLAAADRALEMGATADAYAQLAAAVSVWDRASRAMQRRLGDRRGLYLRLVTTAHGSGRFAEVIAGLDELERIGPPASVDEELRLLGLRCNASWALGDNDAALAVAQRAVARAPANDARSRAMALHFLAGVYMVTDRAVEGLRIAKEGLRHALASGERTAERYLRGVMALGLQAAGRSTDALRESNRAYGISAGGDLIEPYATPINHATLLALCGRYEQVLTVTARPRQEIQRAGLTETYGAALDNLELYALIRLGRHADANGILDRTRDAPPKMSSLVRERVAFEALLRVREGRLAEAATLTTWLRVEAMAQDQNWVWGALRLAELEQLLFNGELTAATDRAAQIDGSQLASVMPFRLRLLCLAQRAVSDALTASRGRSEKLAAERARLSGETRAIKTSITQSTVEWEALILEAEAEALRAQAEAADAWRRAADAWMAAGVPFETAYASCRLGEALLARRDRAGALSALQAARATATRIGAPLIEAMARGIANRAGITELGDDAGERPTAAPPARAPLSAHGALSGLSVREREVLALVAEGLTNRQIAERLFISEKTSGTHVSNILGKLGAVSRAQAAAMLASAPGNG
ncbi:MAG: LuxR C-terminal-related transcriptional regulator [Chloroflexota bacterium]